MATIVACGAFSAVSGSSAATTATIGKVAMPSMHKYGYANTLSTGSIAAGGALGILIPPSTALVVYGIMTETNIGTLFIAGIVPGIVTILLYVTAVYFYSRLNPEAGPPAAKSGWARRIASLKSTCGITVLFGMIVGGIMIGAFTVVEAAGIGAFGALVILLVRKGPAVRVIFGALVDAGRTTAVLMAVIVAASVFSNFLDVTGAPNTISAFLSGLDFSPVAILAIIMLIYVVLGCFLEGFAMMLLTVPLFYPIVASLGIDLAYFGIMVVVVSELAMMTPPIGMNVFILKGVFPEIPVRDIYRGVLPFIVADVSRICLFLAFPAIVMFLPKVAG